MSDDEIIQQRVSGRSVRAIARTFGVTAAEVSAALDRFATAMIDDKVRKHTLALELARLDELQETFYARALEGDARDDLEPDAAVESDHAHSDCVSSPRFVGYPRVFNVRNDVSRVE